LLGERRDNEVHADYPIREWDIGTQCDLSALEREHMEFKLQKVYYGATRLPQGVNMTSIISIPIINFREEILYVLSQ
jgi:hypothetical protein